MDYIIINKEVFKQIRFNERYYINQNGDVYSTYANKIIKPLLHGRNNKKYKYVDIYVDGKQRHMKIHRLVYDTWVRNINSDELVLHKDDDCLNNNVSNLYVGDQSENIDDCFENGHRVGNVFYLTIYDRDIDKTITFCPASDFIKYSGHPCANGNLNRMFSKNWFKKRYKIIEYKRINNIIELKDVTTMADECKPVG